MTNQPAPARQWQPNLLCMKGTAALRAAVVASHRTVAPGKKPALLQLPSGNLLQFANLKMAIEIVDLPIENGYFP